jgi:LysR family transcriptional regulator, glycine cleavage system transcriptional activator
MFVSFPHMPRTPSSPPLPLTALRAFEAVVRLGGMNRAAEALGVTHGAISRQIAALEARLQVQLFEGPRNARRPTLAARELAAEIEPAFARLEQAMATRRPEPTVIIASCLSTLATRWLIPRLGDLAQSTGLSLDLRESYAPPDRSLGGCDIAIRMMAVGQTPPAGLIATPFMSNPIGVVMAPALKDHPTPPRLASRSHPRAWNDWAACRGVGDEPGEPILFDHQQTMIEAAASGLGACVVQRPLVETDLASGRLIAPNGFVDEGARFCVLHHDKPTLSLRRLIQWLAEQGAASARFGETPAGHPQPRQPERGKPECASLGRV